MGTHSNIKSSSTPYGLQTVFRFKSTRAKEKGSSSVGNLQRSSFGSRRSHTKSRTGCQNCKSRRVKCDETKDGGCLRCRSHGIDCDYVLVNVVEDQTPLPDHDDLLSEPSVSPSSGPISAVLTPSDRTIAIVHPSLSEPTPLRYQLPANITPYLQTLKHFQSFTCQTITSPDGICIFETSIMAIANQSEYLMHAILGTAAAHLAWHASLYGSSIEHKEHQQAEAYHWQRAIKMFRNKLASLEERNAETVDTLISICMLLGIHSYFSYGTNDESSFVWRSEGERSAALRWLNIQSGFGLLLRSLGGRAALSVWLDVFNTAARDKSGFLPEMTMTASVYHDFLDLCAIDACSTIENNFYLTAIQDLFTLLRVGPPTMENFAMLMAFMGRLVGPFQELLVKRDAAAMLIVAYWLTLMHELRLWWIDGRARCECTAIVTFLKGDNDPRVRRLLRFPAKAMALDQTICYDGED